MQDGDETKVETTKTALRRIDISNLIEMIERGFIHFKIEEFNKFSPCFEELAKEQHPKFLVFACIDSRVCLSRVLDFRPGDAFMARNIANFVLGFNQVEVILVIGHSKCGGIKTLMALPDDAAPTYDFIHDWIKIGLPAKAKVMAEFGNEPFEIQCKMCEKKSFRFEVSTLEPNPSSGFEFS
ncbi:hypothetical protein Vadar_001156 [Vaccinium darrowii]|uniref:Uncharacterized protein n=1 Tax=Vaccinium darrowii TaxID=229202 RepID=A0ACB7ZGI5_9ERIC|nr:hypothetical protein Vadar_001156 [Vaccinium darrowii]